MLRALFRRRVPGVAVILLFLLAPFEGMVSQVQAKDRANSSAPVSVFATGLNSPRGLSFGPDGSLYVSEAGLGGKQSTVGQCTQVKAPVGPYTNGPTARISKISPAGVRTTVLDGLPSAQTNPVGGYTTVGVAQTAFIGHSLYALLSSGGCSHGNTKIPSALIKVDSHEHTWKITTDLSRYIKTHPIKYRDPDDYEPDGDYYSMVTLNGSLYLTQANGQEIDRITPNGQITRVADLSTLFTPPDNWQGPTGITAHNGNLYFGVLGTFPARPGTQNLYELTPNGFLRVVASGLTTVLGIAFDKHGHLFALENFTVPGYPGPKAVGTGKVVCIGKNGTINTVASGLTFPTGMTFGPDGGLYVSNLGYGVPTPGAGQILRVDTSTATC